MGDEKAHFICVCAARRKGDDESHQFNLLEKKEGYETNGLKAALT
jgi:hypothetical protein